MVDVDAFIERWQGKEGGAERANYALFLSELCDVLGVGRPDPAGATHELNDYVFERAVVRREGGERSANKRIDLYKRNSFILEAKQSRWMGGDKAIPGQEDMFQAEGLAGAGRRGVARNWDILMRNARQQAEQYALMLPADHDWPPFIIVCDVGHVLEIYADFNGKGRDYTQFPNRQGFRIYLEDLRREDIRERLRLIWTDPQALDPTRKAAEATRQVAERLAEVSKLLDGRGYAPERVAQFLMRCLFTMFAEDVELLPKKSFEDLLRKCAQDDAKFVPMVSQLWAAMNTGDWAYAIEAKVKRFNGEFFANPEVLPLNREEIGELLVAAGKEWRRVEPAIVGSLFEGALDPGERSRLGAHYTPRAYVERLVLPTIMEPLRADWDAVNVTVEKLLEGKREGEAIAAVRAFHESSAPSGSSIRPVAPAIYSMSRWTRSSSSKTRCSKPSRRWAGRRRWRSTSCASTRTSSSASRSTRALRPSPNWCCESAFCKSTIAAIATIPSSRSCAPSTISNAATRC